MKVEVYKGAQGKHNLKDYEEIYNTFDWKDVATSIFLERNWKK